MKERFNLSNTDITFRSSDGVEFKLHRALLEAYTGAFPGPEIDTRGEVIQLTEPAKVLKILFDFVYPRRHPDLEDSDYEFVASVAEAVGKYEVYSAINTCNARLKSVLPDHAADIFVHAIKHDHAKLINATVPYLARSPFITVLKKLPPSYMVPWSQYHEAWTSVFKEGIEYIKRLPASGNQCHATPGFSGFGMPNTVASSASNICHACRSASFIWITNLEVLDSISVLNDAVQAGITKSTGLSCCGAVSDVHRTPYGNMSPARLDYKCTHIVELAKFLQDKIIAIPTFSTFLVNGVEIQE